MKVKKIRRGKHEKRKGQKDEKKLKRLFIRHDRRGNVEYDSLSYVNVFLGIGLGIHPIGVK